MSILAKRVWKTAVRTTPDASPVRACVVGMLAKIGTIGAAVGVVGVAGIGAVVGIAGIAAPASAQLVTFQGRDIGAGPGQARPLSNAAAMSFDSAAAMLGTVSPITFESLAVGNFTGLLVAPGVRCELIGTAGDSNAGITSDFGSPTLGFNTTTAGSKHLRIVPQLDVGTVEVRFSFDTPIEAWGAYLTGLGTANGALSVQFNDGAAQSLSVVGGVGGGVQFFGFTDTGRSITQVSLVLTGVTGGTRDIFGIDDMRAVAPAPGGVGVVLGGGLAAVRRRRRA